MRALATAALLLAPVGARSQDPTAALSKWSAEELATAEAFVRAFVADVAAGAAERAVDSFDRTQMLERVFDGIGTERLRATMKKEAQKTSRQSLLFALQTFGQSASRVKRLVAVDGALRARVRFYGEQGVSIVDFELTRRGDTWAFCDLHNLTLGVSSVGEMRTMALLLSGQSSRGLLERLLGTGSVSATDVENLNAMLKAFQAGDLAAGGSSYDKLPKSLQESSTVTAIRLQMLAAGSDETAYIEALESAAARFPPPKFRMTLVDAHFLRQRWQDAIRCIDEAMQSIEPDAMLLMLRATIQLQSGDVAAASKSSAAALALEPDTLEVLAASLDIVLAAKDWAAVVRTMEAMEKSGEYDFKGQLDDAVWAEFRDQPEAKRWL